MAILFKRNNRYGFENWEWDKLSRWQRFTIFWWKIKRISLLKCTSLPFCFFDFFRARQKFLGESMKLREFQCRCNKTGENVYCWCKCADGILSQGCGEYGRQDKETTKEVTNNGL